MKVLDLFSGIGGFSLGLERAGLKTIAFCEIDKSAQKVLRKHWPDIPIFEDIRKLKASLLTEKVDLICGGFPCQDISVAGKGEGLNGERSGLWREYYRVIQEVQPRFVVIENVSNLRNKGLNQVLKDLWEIGFNCEWHCIPASAVGAPHERERIWIIAHSKCQGLQGPILKRSSLPVSTEQEITKFGDKNILASGEFIGWHSRALRVGNGLSNRVDKNRIKQLGNAVIPQIPELIGSAIMIEGLRNEKTN